jgi:adenylate cyclase
MGTEIERKFLVEGDAWRKDVAGVRFRQGYLNTNKARTVRVRVAGDAAFLTIKGATTGIERAEYEYAIPVGDADEMLERLCEQPIIDKTRYTISSGSVVIEVDEFWGENEGLILAEVELANEAQTFVRPIWLGAEVSHDPRYFNSSLVTHPFRAWAKT